MTGLAHVLRPPRGAPALPPFDGGWIVDGRREPYLEYAEAIDVNWSPELAAMHDESSRTHFIDVQTRWSLVRAAGRVPAGGIVLDVGCGQGYLVEDLRARLPGTTIVGIDLVATALQAAHAHVPEAPLLLADCTALPFADATVDAVVSANVLEHVRDDVAALREIRRVLKPGARAGIVVPAAPGLYDAYDEHLGHERRYARHELARKARAAGLQVTEDAYLGSIVFPPFWAVKKRNKRRQANMTPGDREALVEREIARTQGSKLGDAASRLEAKLLERGVRLPFGIRAYVTMRKF